MDLSFEFISSQLYLCELWIDQKPIWRHTKHGVEKVCVHLCSWYQWDLQITIWLILLCKTYSAYIKLTPGGMKEKSHVERGSRAAETWINDVLSSKSFEPHTSPECCYSWYSKVVRTQSCWRIHFLVKENKIKGILGNASRFIFLIFHCFVIFAVNWFHDAYWDIMYSAK